MNPDDNANQAPPAEVEKPISIIFVYKDETRGILQEIARERQRQDEQWGGPEHDDTHERSDWLVLIQTQLHLAVTPSLSVVPGRIEEYRERLVKTAALAVAALEALDRRHPPQPASEPTSYRPMTCGDLMPEDMVLRQYGEPPTSEREG